VVRARCAVAAEGRSVTVAVMGMLDRLGGASGPLVVGFCEPSDLPRPACIDLFLKLARGTQWFEVLDSFDCRGDAVLPNIPFL